MSVLVADLEVYSYVAHVMHKVAYNKVINDHYSHIITKVVGDSIDPWEESKRLVTEWLNLNERSYNVRYEKQDYANLWNFLQFNHSPEKIDAYQLLKYLQCIRYNIEVETITHKGNHKENPELVTDQQRKDLEVLEAFIADIKNSIINSLPQYKAAKYSEV
jgi:hypothetical protein